MTKRGVKRATVAAVRGASAAAKRAEALVALIERRKQRITEDFYDIGEALRELGKAKHYEALGYSSFEALLEARKLMGRTQAYKLVQIVETFPREQALALGSERAFAVISYAAATPAADVPRFIAETGVIGKKRIADMSAREIDATARKVRARRAEKTTPTPEQRAAAKNARAWQAALRKKGARSASADVIRDGGAWWIVVRVPADAPAP